ncbi:DUF4232 domain-containing protein [Kitasatospora sp. NPDC059327]|uniref:DUF4232 domain-containing protein n=1 Tax=Kitasatospora sp. NPDC059327 TaxID=3346803 RepID=UPI0036BAF569
MNAMPRTGIRPVPLLGRVALLGAAAALVAGCGSTHVTAAGGGGPVHPGPTLGAFTPDASVTLPTPSAPPPAACTPEGVSLAAEEVNAAMGLRVMGIRLTNCGSRPYTLNGRPGIRVLDAERAPLGITVRNGSAGIATLEGFDAAPKAVTLDPGEYAAFQLVWRNTVTAGTSSADNGRFLEIAPLPGRPRVVVPADLDLGTTGRLGVSAWSEPAEAGPGEARPGPLRPGSRSRRCPRPARRVRRPG